MSDSRDPVELEVEDTEATDGSDSKLKELSEQIVARCKAADIVVRTREEDPEGILPRLEVDMQNGREKRTLALFNVGDCEQFLSIEFERYCFLGRYDAICSYEYGEVEALIRVVSAAPILPAFGVLARLHGVPTPISRAKYEELSALEVKCRDESRGLEIGVGGVSKTLSALISGHSRFALSIKIRGLRVTTHDDALKALDTLGHSALFQIDQATEVPFSLVRSRRFRRLRRRLPLPKFDFAFPKVEFDSEVISLYRYGRSARGMPLLQFLAFYQVVEFYFPVYAQLEAKRSLGAILKDPNFRVHRDADLARALSVLRSHVGRGNLDERSQLRATLLECIDATVLRDFIVFDPETLSFLKEDKRLGVRRINPANDTADIRTEVSERLYEIRCKLVHTKAGQNDGMELLLPYSEEAELLEFDVELMRFVAEKVIIANSRPLGAF